MRFILIVVCLSFFIFLLFLSSPLNSHFAYFILSIILSPFSYYLTLFSIYTSSVPPFIVFLFIHLLPFFSSFSLVPNPACMWRNVRMAKNKQTQATHIKSTVDQYSEYAHVQDVLPVVSVSSDRTHFDICMLVFSVLPSVQYLAAVQLSIRLAEHFSNLLVGFPHRANIFRCNWLLSCLGTNNLHIYCYQQPP